MSKVALSKQYPKEYQAWRDMLKRCYNPKCKYYADYGGRGIFVCLRWRLSFRLFLEDMKTAPSAVHSLDRYPNNNGNYEPSNCRWATPKEQSRNTRQNRILELNGESKCLIEWAREYAIHPMTITIRLKRGYTVEEAITTPVFGKYKKRKRK